MGDRNRLRVGRGVLYTPTAAEATAQGAGPWAAQIVDVNSDGSVDLTLFPPGVETTVPSAVADPLIAATNLAAQVASASSQIAAADEDASNGVMHGVMVEIPNAASTQITGAGDTEWRVDVALGHVIAEDIELELAVEADRVLHSGSQLLVNGQSAYAWLYVKEDGGTVTLETLVGTPDTTGAQTVPSDADIDSDATVATWFKVALCLLNRTGDTTVTQSQDNSFRQAWRAEVALSAELKLDVNAMQLEIVELITLYAATLTMCNELKADVNTLVTLVNALRDETTNNRKTSVAIGGGLGQYALEGRTDI